MKLSVWVRIPHPTPTLFQGRGTVTGIKERNEAGGNHLRNVVELHTGEHRSRSRIALRVNPFHNEVLVRATPMGPGI